MGSVHASGCISWRSSAQTREAGVSEAPWGSKCGTDSPHESLAPHPTHPLSWGLAPQKTAPTHKPIFTRQTSDCGSLPLTFLTIFLFCFRNSENIGLVDGLRFISLRCTYSFLKETVPVRFLGLGTWTHWARNCEHVFLLCHPGSGFHKEMSSFLVSFLPVISLVITAPRVCVCVCSRSLACDSVGRF